MARCGTGRFSIHIVTPDIFFAAGMDLTSLDSSLEIDII